jgi:hypothetical protein
MDPADVEVPATDSTPGSSPLERGQGCVGDQGRASPGEEVVPVDQTGVGDVASTPVTLRVAEKWVVPADDDGGRVVEPRRAGGWRQDGIERDSSSRVSALATCRGSRTTSRQRLRAVVSPDWRKGSNIVMT